MTTAVVTMIAADHPLEMGTMTVVAASIAHPMADVAIVLPLIVAVEVVGAVFVGVDPALHLVTVDEVVALPVIIPTMGDTMTTAGEGVTMGIVAAKALRLTVVDQAQALVLVGDPALIATAVVIAIEDIVVKEVSRIMQEKGM